MTKLTFNENDILVLGTILNTINDRSKLCFCEDCIQIFDEFYETIGSQLIALDKNISKH